MLSPEWSSSCGIVNVSSTWIRPSDGIAVPTRFGVLIVAADELEPILTAA